MLSTDDATERRRSLSPGAVGNGSRRSSAVTATSPKHGLPSPNLHSKVLLACAVQAFFFALLLAYTEPHKYVLEYIDDHYNDFDFPLIDLDLPFIDLFTSDEDGEAEVDVAADAAVVSIDRLFTVDELSTYTGGGKGNKPVYLAILGRVYDVTKGAKHYGKGGGYSFFAGKDASRSYVTGDFSPAGLVDNVDGLTHQDYLGLQQWVTFYDKDYEHIGYLVGTYYTAKGRETKQLKQVHKWMVAAEAWKESQQDEQERFPPCNSEWTQKAGGRVWCSNKSGGIRRDWVGVPRKLFTPGTKDYRCACVKSTGKPQDDQLNDKDNGDLSHPHLKPYTGCALDVSSCKIKDE